MFVFFPYFERLGNLSPVFQQSFPVFMIYQRVLLAFSKIRRRACNVRAGQLTKSEELQSMGVRPFPVCVLGFSPAELPCPFCLSFQATARGSAQVWSARWIESSPPQERTCSDLSRTLYYRISKCKVVFKWLLKKLKWRFPFFLSYDMLTTPFP